MPELLAIDIGSSKMKFAVGKSRKNSLSISRIFYANTPADAINNGEIVDISLMRDALSVAVQNNRLKGRSAVVTIQSSTFVSRDFTIPKLKPAEAQSALRFEVEQYMPVDMSEYVFSCRELEQLADENGNEVVKYMVGLMPRRIVTAYHDLLKVSGLKPVAMDVNSNCAEKLLGLGGALYADNKDVLLVADIGHDAMDMTVFENGRPTVNRTVTLGGAEITRNISGMLMLDFDEAEIKKVQSVDLLGQPEPGSEEENVTNIAKMAVADWAEQLRRMSEFYMSRTKGKAVDLIYIYGGSSALKGLESYMSGQFGFTVKIMAPPANVKLKDTSPAPVYTFLNAMGAIIRR